MLKVGDKVSVSVTKDNALWQFNGEEGVVEGITKDLVGYEMYKVNSNGNFIVAFESELKGVK